MWGSECPMKRAVGTRESERELWGPRSHRGSCGDQRVTEGAVGTRESQKELWGSESHREMWGSKSHRELWGSESHIGSCEDQRVTERPVETRVTPESQSVTEGDMGLRESQREMDEILRREQRPSASDPIVTL